jgi:hypothetical protein
MNDKKIQVDVLSLKGEKLQSLQIALSDTIYKLQLQIYELLGLDTQEEENHPEMYWKRPRVPLVCLAQFLHSLPRDTLVLDYITKMLGERADTTITPLHIRVAIDTALLLSFQAQVINTQTTERQLSNRIEREQDHAGHVQKLLPNFGSCCGGNRVRVLGEGIPVGSNAYTLCRFGRVIVEGVSLSCHEVQCIAPVE